MSYVDFAAINPPTHRLPCARAAAGCTRTVLVVVGQPTQTCGYCRATVAPLVSGYDPHDPYSRIDPDAAHDRAAVDY